MRKSTLIPLVILLVSFWWTGPDLAGAATETPPSINIPATAETNRHSAPPDGLPGDLDGDSLSNTDEMFIYHTDPANWDSDGDTWGDGDEIANDYDPNINSPDRVARHLEVSLGNQTLTYFLGPYGFKTIKISSGAPGHLTPTGTFTIDKKLDEVLYQGPGYYYPHTKWNMRFKISRGGNYYIHGAYWHERFGEPVSHGCVNVSYADMEPLYNWTPPGTQVIIRN